ncbi:YlxM family DNA-binding protein [Fodinisporobacter ferrooxydans]|uniref:UPF0122 protein LSG31_15085 n=1 Tax=Fodinisporobacter ferrooxydans TaxID=2901836 RepID=A0ABY4CFC3_9BACL|nr:YlxM family DNA-binding protein [Alicyclobacillaceae bacterium MYW30-H2]
MLEKTQRINLLFDFYGALLTERQQQMVELYYLDDLSLAEIAENFSISRQAVHDALRRSCQQLEEFEAKLHSLEKFEHRQQSILHILSELDARILQPIGEFQQLELYHPLVSIYHKIERLLED